MSDQSQASNDEHKEGGSDTPSSPKPDSEKAGAIESPKAKSSKVEILLYATGDTPIIKTKKWTLEPSKTIAFISNFVKKLIKCDPKDSLFLYVNQSFAPSPDAEVGSLYECFGSDGKLVLHYCKTQAWG